MKTLTGHFALTPGLGCGLLLVFSLLGTLSVQAQYTDSDLSPGDTFLVTDSADVDITVTLPEGADILRVTVGNWTTASGGAQSADFSVTLVGPDSQTGAIAVFDNALDTTAGVVNLEGEIILSSKGTAGVYTLTFSTSRASSSANFSNVQIDAEVILDSFTDSGSLTSGSPTWDRPNDAFLADGTGTHYYETFSFTPLFSGDYVITSEQVKDGFIFLYSTFSAGSPTTNGIVASDDSARGIGFSKMSTTLTGGTPYTLVSTSFEDISTGQATFNYTNTIRYSVRLDMLPNSWVAFKQLNSLTSFTSDKDNDGILDGFEYAFNSDPDAADDISDFQELLYDSVNDTLSLKFTRDSGKADIEYIVEGNDTLNPLTWSVIETVDSSTASNNVSGEPTLYEVDDTTKVDDSTTDSRFLRLRINYTGP